MLARAGGRRAVGAGGAQEVGYENNLATTSALFALAWEIRNSSNWTPYIGGTAGWVRNHSSVDRNVIGAGSTTHDNDTDDLGLGIMFGTTWDFSENWGMDFAYRYINLGEVDTGVMANNDQITADYESHEALITVNYRF